MSVIFVFYSTVHRLHIDLSTMFNQCGILKACEVWESEETYCIVHVHMYTLILDVGAWQKDEIFVLKIRMTRSCASYTRIIPVKTGWLVGIYGLADWVWQWRIQ